MKCYSILLVLSLGLSNADSWAVDSRNLLDRFSLMGIITSGAHTSQQDVAVIKDNETSRTMTLRVGDELPASSGFNVKTIKSKQVTLTDGRTTATLVFEGNGISKSETSPQKSSLSNADSSALDVYYYGRDSNSFSEENGLVIDLDEFKERAADIQPLRKQILKDPSLPHRFNLLDSPETRGDRPGAEPLNQFELNSNSNLDQNAVQLDGDWYFSE